MARGKDDKGGEGGFQWKNFVTYLGSVCVLILCVALLVAMSLGLRPLEDKAAQVVNLASPKVHLTWPINAVTPDGKPSTWLPKQNQDEIQQLVIDALGDTSREAFSREPLERVSRALEQSGWFDGAPVVRRGEGGSLDINGKWRLPFAFVRFKDEDYLISQDGKRMPPVKKAGLERAFRTIQNPAVGPPAFGDGSADYSKAWSGEDIVASVELLQLMQEKPWFTQVAGVDAADYSANGKLVLVTPEKTRVVWGGRPSKPIIGEVSTAQKLAHLTQIMHDYKRIDAKYPLIYINGANLQFDISATATQP
jgi:hypothetical protein